jgi:hypothetical protein
MVGGIQRIYDGRWDPSEEKVSGNNNSEQVTQCMDLEHLCPLATLGAHYTGYTWSPLHWLYFEPTHQEYSTTSINRHLVLLIEPTHQEEDPQYYLY